MECLLMVATTDDRLHVAIVLEVTATTTVTGALAVNTMMTGDIDHLLVVDPLMSTAHLVDVTMTLTDGITHLPTHMSTAVPTIGPRENSPHVKVDMGRVKVPRIPVRITVEEEATSKLSLLYLSECTPLHSLDLRLQSGMK
jgi:hypothetical protein